MEYFNPFILQGLQLPENSRKFILHVVSCRSSFESDIFKNMLTDISKNKL